MKLQHINGATRLYGIIGDPVYAVRSPEVFNTLFAQNGINAVFVPVQVAAAGLGAAWAGLKSIGNLDGLVVTMPHKTRMAALLDTVGEAGRLVGAVNAARRGPDGGWHGDMFDGAGFVDGLLAEGHQVSGQTMRLRGLGGAGTAIAFALAQAGVATLVLNDLDGRRQRDLCQRLGPAFPATRITDQADPGMRLDAVINATPLGMKPSDPLPFDPELLPPETLVVDIVTKPEITPLLQLALKSGHRIHCGKHMHLGQARLVAEFFGFRPLQKPTTRLAGKPS